MVENCNNSKFFTLIADETTDTSTREQISVYLRYLERDTITNKISVKKDFLDFTMATSTTGEHLAELLIETLISAVIIAMNMRTQGYDGAANMSGIYKGVQARTCEMVPGAMYVHCKTHCLNLSIVHSCKDTSVRNVMSTVQEVAFSFDYSSKKLQAFYQDLNSDATTKENMEKRTKLRTLCETRWTSRADVLNTFKASFPVVVHALERLRENGDDKAGQYLASITRFEFVIALIVSEHILQSMVYQWKYLQGIECDLLEATKECRTVIEMLRTERSDEAVWNEIYQTTLDLSEPFDIVENNPEVMRSTDNQSQSP
ncbi:zinc finger MYM-type protein 1-like [Mytilus trossulus]|uniref:zinc finger MYM-type protein 1-like n=1 Tax=Mytilus trossulus TaxID=6551 RepID=UPI00300420CA